MMRDEDEDEDDEELGCQLLSNYSEVTVITVFWASDFGYCLF